MNEIRPGEVMSVRCPDGSTPQLRVGDTLSVDSKATMVVVRIEDRDVVLGALRAGQFTVPVACSNNQNVNAEYSLKALKKEEMPEKAQPLIPFDAVYPLWFWFMLIFILLSILTGGYFIYRRVRRKLTPPKAPKVAAQATPAQKLEAFLREAQKAKWVSASEDSAVSLLYGQGYEGLRKFVEAHLKLKTMIETTREFLGSLRAVAPQLGVSSQIFEKIEYCLTQADAVRFAKEIPPTESRKQFLKYIEEVYENLRPKAQSKPGGVKS